MLYKKDIEAVAYSRFNRNHSKHIVGFLAGLIVYTIVLGLTLPNEWILASKIATLSSIMVFYLLGATWYIKASNRAAKALLKECKDNPNITYND